MSEKKAEYKAFPEFSPYLKSDRYENPKEDHKFILSIIKKFYDKNSLIEVCDLGCANGDLLYLINRNFPKWKLTGFDFTKEFIEYANSIEDLKEIKFIHEDLFKVKGNYDIVLSDGVTQIFPDIEKTINKYLDLCKDGGYIITTGRFNKYDIEVRLQYCDNSNPHTKNIWREDWCQHSRTSVYNLFSDKVKKLEFIDVIMDKNLPQDSSSPINQWTFRDAEGNNIITNGTNLMLNKTILLIKK